MAGASDLSPISAERFGAPSLHDRIAVLQRVQQRRPRRRIADQPERERGHLPDFDFGIAQAPAAAPEWLPAGRRVRARAPRGAACALHRRAAAGSDRMAVAVRRSPGVPSSPGRGSTGGGGFGSRRMRWSSSRRIHAELLFPRDDRRLDRRGAARRRAGARAATQAAMPGRNAQRSMRNVHRA